MIFFLVKVVSIWKLFENNAHDRYAEWVFVNGVVTKETNQKDV